MGGEMKFHRGEIDPQRVTFNPPKSIQPTAFYSDWKSFLHRPALLLILCWSFALGAISDQQKFLSFGLKEELKKYQGL